MNDVLLDAEIGGVGRAVEIGGAADADRAGGESAAEVLRERTHRGARVVAEWPRAHEADTIRLPLRITGRDPPWHAELFLHEAFLMLNLAAPGSFGGTISFAGGDAFTLDQRLFEYAWAAARGGIAPLPLARVAAWYDGLRIDPARPADTPAARALFHLLHLARSAEDEVLSIVRLAQAAEALGSGEPMLFQMRDAVVRADAPVSHPVIDGD